MPEVLISEITIGKRHRKAVVNIDALAASITEVGLLQPVVITPEKKLVAGFRRIKAYEQLGRAKIPTIIAKSLDEAALLLKAERDENTCREPFTIEEGVAMREAIDEIERRSAKQRQDASFPKKGQKGFRANVPQSLGNIANKHAGESARRSAAAVGMSVTTAAKAKTVIQAAKAEPEKFRPLVDEMNRTGKVNGAFKKLTTAKAAEQIKAEPPPLPSGPFRVLVVDPPWKYDGRPDDPTHRAANPYPSMEVDEIMAMNVNMMACDDSILWLWTTNAFMVQAHNVAAAWGFKVKTILTWAKDRMGTGDLLRGQTEHCLICIRGKPTITLTNQTTLLNAPLRAHSQKPEEFFELVEALCPGSKCELFAREPREGYAQHGNESK